MWQSDHVIDAILRRGYQRVAAVSPVQGQAYFLSPHGANGVNQYLGARLISKWNAYEFTFGFACHGARTRLANVSRQLEQINKQPWPDSEAVCLTIFRAGDVLGWDHALIPDPARKDDGAVQWQCLTRQVLESWVEAATTPSQVLEILLQNRAPFRWALAPVVRAAEAIALAVDLGGDVQSVGARLASLSPSLMQPYRDHILWEATVKRLIETLKQPTE